MTYNHITPVDGWTLDRDIYEWGGSDHHSLYSYHARRGDEACILPVSASLRNFQPTQERFAFLVRSGFAGPVRGSWFGAELDAAIATERLAA